MGSWAKFRSICVHIEVLLAFCSQRNAKPLLLAGGVGSEVVTARDFALFSQDHASNVTYNILNCGKTVFNNGKHHLNSLQRVSVPARCKSKPKLCSAPFLLQ